MNINATKTDQFRRKINFIFQTLLVVILFGLGMHEVVPFKVILWQILHFFLIALADYYLDDYPHRKRSFTIILLTLFIIIMSMGLWLGVYAELYMRMHIAILILGNLLGKKVDKPIWLILTIINVLIILVVEVMRDDFRLVFEIALMYMAGTICLLGIAERLSERNKNFWMLHSLILFLWIFFKGPFYQEAFVFLVGGVAYELTKILLNQKVSPTSPANSSQLTGR